MTVSRILICLAAASAAYAQPSSVIIRPKEIQGVLVNPGMGIQTFQRFRGQEIYPGLRWSEVGPEGPAADAPGAVDFPDSTVAYLRWFWSQLEPERGKYRGRSSTRPSRRRGGTGRR